MPPSQEPDWDALARFLAGESAPTEAEAMGRWLAANPRDAEFYRALEARFRAAGRPDPKVDVEAALRKVRARFGDAEVRPIAAARWAHSRGALRWALPLGAVAAAAAAMLILARPMSPPDPDTTQTPVATVPPAVATSYATRPGVRDSILLPDGSRVLLGPGSHLTVPANFGSVRREVQLSGVARFVVMHDAQKPFAVRSEWALIEDIGTVFTVSSDADRRVSVSVSEGVVRIAAGTPAGGGSPSAPVILRAGDRGSVDSAGHTTAEPGTASPDDEAWTAGKLVFRNAPMPRVVAELRRWYGLELRFGDSSLAGRHYSGTFAGDPPNVVLTAVALAIGARVQQRGDTAMLRAQGRPAPPR